MEALLEGLVSRTKSEPNKWLPLFNRNGALWTHLKEAHQLLPKFMPAAEFMDILNKKNLKALGTEKIGGRSPRHTKRQHVDELPVEDTSWNLRLLDLRG